MEQFSPEIVAILAVGVAIAGLVLQQGRRLDRRIDALSMRMDEQDRRTDDRFRQMGDQMNEQFRNLSDRVARVEGKLDLLETFITRRNESPVTPAE